MKRKLPMGKPYDVGFRSAGADEAAAGHPVRPLRARSRPAHRASRHRGVRTARQHHRHRRSTRLRHTRVRIAGSVESIKGYSEIKERAVEEWRAEVRRLVDAGTGLRSRWDGGIRRVIKRLRFADDEAWRDGIDAMLGRAAGRSDRPASPRARPSPRVTVGRPRFSAISVSWRRGSTIRRTCTGSSPADVDRVHGSTVVAAEAIVLRGADWLERRWQDDGPRFKHMALGRAGRRPQRRSSSPSAGVITPGGPDRRPAPRPTSPTTSAAWPTCRTIRSPTTASRPTTP